jgi:hypothetical protein
MTASPCSALARNVAAGFGNIKGADTESDFCKGLFIWKLGWPAKRDSPVSEISLCSYFYSEIYRAFIWASGLAGLPRSRLPEWKFLHINTHKQASPVAEMKVQRYRHKLFLTYCQNNIKITKLSRQAGSGLPVLR